MPTHDGPGPKAPDAARRLYLIRHGETAPLAREGAAADPWHAVLTARGKAQVTDLAGAVSGCHLDLIVTSAVPRAIETATLLAGRTGLRAAIEEGWNELRGGAVLAGSAEEIRRAIQDAFREAGQPGARFLGGESFADFARRVEQALGRLLSQPDWRRAAVVTHQPAIGYLLARCQGLGLDGLAQFEVSPGTASVLEWQEGASNIEQATLRLISGGASDVCGLG